MSFLCWGLQSWCKEVLTLPRFSVIAQKIWPVHLLLLWFQEASAVCVHLGKPCLSALPGCPCWALQSLLMDPVLVASESSSVGGTCCLFHRSHSSPLAGQQSSLSAAVSCSWYCQLTPLTILFIPWSLWRYLSSWEAIRVPLLSVANSRLPRLHTVHLSLSLVPCRSLHLFHQLSFSLNY